MKTRVIELCSESATSEYVLDLIKCGRKFQTIGRTKVVLFD